MVLSDSTIPHGSTLTNGCYQGTCPLIVLIQNVLVCGTMAIPEKKREGGGTPDSTVAVMTTTNFYSNCRCNCIHLAMSA